MGMIHDVRREFDPLYVNAGLCWITHKRRDLSPVAVWEILPLQLIRRDSDEAFIIRRCER